MPPRLPPSKDLSPPLKRPPQPPPPKDPPWPIGKGLNLLPLMIEIRLTITNIRMMNQEVLIKKRMAFAMIKIHQYSKVLPNLCCRQAFGLHKIMILDKNQTWTNLEFEQTCDLDK